MMGLTYRWAALGTRNAVTVTEPAAIAAAARAAGNHVARLDAAASRFRPDSELGRINAAARRGTVTVTVSTVLGACIEASLHAATLTGGLVDPTVGPAVIAAGYDADLAAVQARRELPAPRPGPRRRIDWRAIEYWPSDRRLTLPRGAGIDLGATAKAAAADMIAAELANALPGGFLVDLGGDIAVGGTLPEHGWPIAVEDHRRHHLQVIRGDGQAFATSSTRRRAWNHAGRRSHHIIDPRIGVPSTVHWAQATCAGATAVEANAASTAAIVLGPDAPRWLAERGVPALLASGTGRVVTTPGWPAAEAVSG